MADHFLHGVEVVEIDNGPRPIRTVRSSVIGLVGTAPDADEQRFPLNTPVLIAGSRLEAAKLGATGTLPMAIDGIFDQAGALVVVIRVPKGRPRPRHRPMCSVALMRPVSTLACRRCWRPSRWPR